RRDLLSFSRSTSQLPTPNNQPTNQSINQTIHPTATLPTQHPNTPHLPIKIGWFPKASQENDEDKEPTITTTTITKVL
ncbi:hypothetical protein SAMD00019534_008730, partial [Acytostelium subglobosum LB1]|uniref:hypothetical protein n=1 Tax=Acytostelium subglobosum LB1 TaxID=1410327 RepID=UPI000644B6BB